MEKKLTSLPPLSLRLSRPPKLAKSIRKYIRKEKARIRREVLNLEEQEKQIEELYKKITKKPPSLFEKTKKKKITPSPIPAPVLGEKVEEVKKK